MKPTQDQIREAAAKVGIKVSSFKSRLNRGMTFEEASSMPCMTKSQCGKLGCSRTPWRQQMVFRGTLPYDPEEIRKNREAAKKRSKEYGNV